MAARNDDIRKDGRVALYAMIPEELHESLQLLGLLSKRSLADLATEALQEYLERNKPTVKEVERVFERFKVTKER